MARSIQEVIDTYISITGASEAVALQKLEEYGGNLNEAVNAHFSEGERNNTLSTSVPATQNDFMAIDDPIQVESERPHLPLFPTGRTSLNPFSLLDPDFARRFFDRSNPEFISRAPFVSHPREVREIPIEFKDGNNQPGHSGQRPTIEDVTGSASAHGPEIHGNVIIDDDDDDDDDDISTAPTGQAARLHERHPRPSAPEFDSLNDGANYTEEEMIQAAIEASKREVEEGYQNQQIGAPHDSYSPQLQPRQSHFEDEDTELAHAVSLSLKTAEQEKAMREQRGMFGVAEHSGFNLSNVEELGQLTAENGRQEFGSFIPSQIKSEAGSSSIQDEDDDVEEQSFARHRSIRVYSRSRESAKDFEEMVDSLPSSPDSHDINNHHQYNGSDEWGGISSEEHNEAITLEAALFGGIPEETTYRFGYAPHQFMMGDSDRNVGPFPQRLPRPPSPTLAVQRLLRKQQDDQYLAALQADREKELRAEARRLEEKAAREAALQKERQKEEESSRKFLEKEEFERKLARKEASLPQEPASDDENAITLLVRMADGSRHSRRFLKSDKLQSLFDFIDVGRVVKPGTYRLVRPYPRRAFSDGESEMSLHDLGLISKHEALFLELI